MSASVRAGLSVGPTSEFSLFFRVKPGEANAMWDRTRLTCDASGWKRAGVDASGPMDDGRRVD
jgi:hypothetical protein